MTVRINHINVNDAFRVGALMGFMLSLIFAVVYFLVAMGGLIIQTSGNLIAFRATDCLNLALIVLFGTLIWGISGALVASLYNLIAGAFGGVTMKLSRATKELPESPESMPRPAK